MDMAPHSNNARMKALLARTASLKRKAWATVGLGCAAAACALIIVGWGLPADAERVVLWVFVGLALCTTALMVHTLSALDDTTKDMRQCAENLKLTLEARDQAEHHREAAEDALTRSQKLETLGLLARDLSHDFDNALLVIQTWASILQRSPSDPDVVHESGKEIHSAVLHASRLNRQLRMHVRPGHGDSALLSCALPAQLQTLRTLFAPTVKLDVDCHTDRRVTLDESALQQVILNLALNARAAMNVHGHFALRACEHTMDDGEQGVLLTVEDDGVGMDEDTQRQIFEPFFTTRSNGTGLGLSSVQTLIHSVGGQISVSSKPGSGCRFDIVLPCVEPNSDHRDRTF